MKTAIALLSGGLDSTTATTLSVRTSTTVHAISFDYGQRHDAELLAAKRIADSLGITHETIQIGAWGGSALNDAIDVPRDRDEATMADGIPVTYVPARNTLFLAYAVAIAESTAADYIVAGVNAVDYSGYPDCRPEFIDAFQRAVNLGTRRGGTTRPIIISTPLITLTKADIIRLAVRIDAPLHLTHSCYDPVWTSEPLPQALACGHCDSCIIRRKGFEDAGIEDPTRYAPEERVHA